MTTPRSGSLGLRRTVEALHGMDCRRVEGTLALKDGRLTFDIATTLEGLRPPRRVGTKPPAVEPAWLERFPAANVMAIVSVAVDPGPAFWDRAFSLADRVERADPRVPESPHYERASTCSRWPRASSPRPISGRTSAVCRLASGAIPGGPDSRSAHCSCCTSTRDRTPSGWPGNSCRGSARSSRVERGTRTHHPLDRLRGRPRGRTRGAATRRDPTRPEPVGLAARPGRHDRLGRRRPHGFAEVEGPAGALHRDGLPCVGPRWPRRPPAFRRILARPARSASQQLESTRRQRYASSPTIRPSSGGAGTRAIVPTTDSDGRTWRVGFGDSSRQFPSIRLKSRDAPLWWCRSVAHPLPHIRVSNVRVLICRNGRSTSVGRHVGRPGTASSLRTDVVSPYLVIQIEFSISKARCLHKGSHSLFEP